MSLRHARLPRSPRAAARLAALLSTVAAGAACGGKDPYAPVAQYPTIPTTSFTLFPLSRVVAPGNSALDLRSPLPVRPEVYLSSTLGELVPNFDFAVDVDSAGHIVFLPPKLVTSTTYVPRTGFQISSTLYDSLRAAPGGTYQADSAFRVTTGQTVVVQAQGVACPVASPFYAKVVIDSVSAATGAMYLRAYVDPNCGFKSFTSGIPTS